MDDRPLLSHDTLVSDVHDRNIILSDGDSIKSHDSQTNSVRRGGTRRHRVSSKLSDTSHYKNIGGLLAVNQRYRFASSSTRERFPSDVSLRSGGNGGQLRISIPQNGKEGKSNFKLSSMQTPKIKPPMADYESQAQAMFMHMNPTHTYKMNAWKVWWPPILLLLPSCLLLTLGIASLFVFSWLQDIFGIPEDKSTSGIDACISVSFIIGGILAPVLILRCVAWVKSPRRIDPQKVLSYADPLLDVLLSNKAALEHYDVLGGQHRVNGTILLLAGSGAPRRIMLPIAVRLALSYRVIMADIPGQGSLSSVPFSLNRGSRTICHILDREIGLEEGMQRVLLISWGASTYLAAHLCSTDPHRIAGLITCGPVPNYVSPKPCSSTGFEKTYRLYWMCAWKNFFMQRQVSATLLADALNEAYRLHQQSMSIRQPAQNRWRRSRHGSNLSESGDSKTTHTPVVRPFGRNSDASQTSAVYAVDYGQKNGDISSHTTLQENRTLNKSVGNVSEGGISLPEYKSNHDKYILPPGHTKSREKRAPVKIGGLNIPQWGQLQTIPDGEAIGDKGISPSMTTMNTTQVMEWTADKRCLLDDFNYRTIPRVIGAVRRRNLFARLRDFPRAVLVLGPSKWCKQARVLCPVGHVEIKVYKSLSYILPPQTQKEVQTVCEDILSFANGQTLSQRMSEHEARQLRKASMSSYTSLTGAW